MTDLNSIVYRLIARTQEGKLKWSETVRGDEFATSVDAISIKISKPALTLTLALATKEIYRLEILDESGRVVESLNSDDPTVDDQTTFQRLHAAARRSALDIDSILEQLNKALDP